MSRALEDAARKVRAAGRRGDTVLAHINPAEAALLKRMGGAGSVNPRTGLPEFSWGEDGGLGGGSGSDTFSDGGWGSGDWSGGWGDGYSVDTGSGSSDAGGFAPGRNPELGGGLGRQTQANMIEESFGGGLFGSIARGGRDALLGSFGLSVSPALDQKSGLFGQKLSLDPLGGLAMGASLFGLSAKAVEAAFGAFGPKGAMVAALGLDPKTVNGLSALAGRPFSVGLGFAPALQAPGAGPAFGVGAGGDGLALLAPAPADAPKSTRPAAAAAPQSTLRSTVRGVGRAKGQAAGGTADLLGPAAADDPLDALRAGLLAPRR